MQLIQVLAEVRDQLVWFIRRKKISDRTKDHQLTVKDIVLRKTHMS